MKNSFLLISFLVASCICKAQITFPKNYLYFEAIGNGGFGSFNYERQLTKKPAIGIHVGIGFYLEDSYYITMPAGINYLFQLKKENRFIDAGFGVSWMQYEGKFFSKNKTAIENSYLNFIPSIGYRWHTQSVGYKKFAKNLVMWRVSATPIINKYAFTPWIGVSIGKTF